ncbi:MAG: HAMP domain-containing histidine kinase [Spirochaetia bacterium]|nr:HAMP domain-containing histidine kinase [Spirochaetia bacterium]
MKHASLTGAACLFVSLWVLFYASPASAQEFSENLSGTWHMTLNDDPANADPDLEETKTGSGWSAIEMPSNLARFGAVNDAPVWVRHRFQFSAAEKNVALSLGPVYDTDQTYLNGELIGQTGTPGTRSTAYARPRIYPVPARLLKQGENVIAIRIIGQFRSQIGVTNNPIKIIGVQTAVWDLWKGELRNLAYAAIYFSASIFFLILHFRIGGMKEYLMYAALALTFAVQQFARNEYRFVLGDVFFFFKLVEQLCYVALPTAFYFFFFRFFRLDPADALPNPKLKPIVKAASRIYLGINALAALAILAAPVASSTPAVIWDRIITYWFAVNIPFFVLYMYVAASRAFVKWERDALILTAGLALMVIATLQYYAVERGLIKGPAAFGGGVLLFNLTASMALIYRLIHLQLEVQERQDRLNEVNELRDRVFSYLSAFIKKPADSIAAKCLALIQPDLPASEGTSLFLEAQREIDTTQANLDDILELSRLEVIPQPEYIEEVNFNDFISAVIPQGGITCHIKVNPDIVLKSSLELVNSVVIRLIDFSGFKIFKHIDLIITSDLKHNVHFRFLLVHDDFRQTRKLYELLTSLNPDKGTLWVKWAIIREIIRILSGDMKINILNRKFLRIDITLQAELPLEAAERSHAGRPIEVTYAHPEGEPGELVEAVAFAGAGAPPVKLSAKMSVGDFIAYVKWRLKKKQK